jgi:hypothetical protein
MGEETAHHILFECEALGRIRYSVLGPPGFELEAIHQEPIKPLLDLIGKQEFMMSSRLCLGAGLAQAV